MREKGFNWGVGLFLIIYQLLVVVASPFYFYYSSLSGPIVAASILLFYLTGLSITAGYHRLYAHRSFRTHPVIEAILLFFGAMAGQGSALRWSFDHRLHHAHVDTDLDPYSIKKGFWYAHCLWLFEKQPPIDPKVIPDLMKNRLVQFQHRHIVSLMILSNVLAFFAVGWLLGDYLGAFFLACWIRLFVLHHATWFINSLAHTWGDKPFCQEQSAVNNYVISLLTFGEGYHNYHHTFANDYRNGIRWYHFDPTKWLIWTLNKLNLTSCLKRMDAYTIKKRMVMQRKELLLNRLCDLWYIKKEELAQKISDLSETIVRKIAETNRLKEHYRQARREGKERERLREVKERIRELRRSLREDWRQWVHLSRHILSLKPLNA